MLLVKPKFEIIEQGSGTIGRFKHIEVCGRTCYKSEDKITEESAPKFVNMIVNRGHLAMLEHGTVYLKINLERNDAFESLASEKATEYIGRTSEPEIVTFYKNNPYSVVKEGLFKSKEVACITTNYRVILENDRISDLDYECEPIRLHEKRVTVRFTCDRGASHEFVRHRVFSFAQESTRYCNYSKDKFGEECTFIIPNWLELFQGHCKYDKELQEMFNVNGSDYMTNCAGAGYGLGTETGEYLFSLYTSENAYIKLLKKGWTPQQARAVLPNSLKTELCMTGTIEQWKGFFKLRCAQDAHPQARKLAIPLEEEFKNRGWI